MRCAICERFAYCSLRTKICWFFAQTQWELGAPCVLCSLQVRGKLIFHALSANWLRTDHKLFVNCSQTTLFACVNHYKADYTLCVITSKISKLCIVYRGWFASMRALWCAQSLLEVVTLRIIKGKIRIYTFFFLEMLTKFVD